MSMWKEIPTSDAQSHPLFGIGGWLLVFAAFLVFGFLQSWGTLRMVAHESEISLWDLLTNDHPYARFLQFEVALRTLLVASVAWLLLTKASIFRNAASGLLLAYVPLLFLNAFINHVPGLVGQIAIPALGGFIGSCVWAIYLHRSERVRITFEHSVRANNDITKNPPVTHRQAATAPVPISQNNVDPNENPVSTSTANTSSEVADDEALWELALLEVDGPQRRNGLWAKCFAQSGGNESIAKANYLDIRVQEMLQMRLRDEQQRLLATQQDALRKEEARQAWEASSKGACPNCETVVLMDATECPKCKASFGIGSIWSPRLIPTSPKPAQEKSISEILIAAQKAGK